MGLKLHLDNFKSQSANQIEKLNSDQMSKQDVINNHVKEIHTLKSKIKDKTSEIIDLNNTIDGLESKMVKLELDVRGNEYLNTTSSSTNMFD